MARPNTEQILLQILKNQRHILYEVDTLMKLRCYPNQCYIEPSFSLSPGLQRDTIKLIKELKKREDKE